MKRPQKNALESVLKRVILRHRMGPQGSGEERDLRRGVEGGCRLVEHQNGRPLQKRPEAQITAGWERGYVVGTAGVS